MLTSECPVCRRPISRFRTFTRTAWSRWRCEGCGSLLGVSLKWRLLATIPWIVLILLMLAVLDIMSLGIAIGLPALIVVGMANYMLLERIIVVERCGFRCKGCGYDLRGQVQPACPECGRQFDDEEIDRMKLTESHAVEARQGRGAAVRRWVTVAVMILLGLAVFVQGLLVFRTRGAQPPAARQTQLVLESILVYADDHDGQMPRHPIEHAGDIYLGPDVFLAPDSATTLASVPVEETSLMAFAAASPSRQKEIIRSVVEALPEGIIAHRLGDFIFTCHDIDLKTAESGLWLVILWPDPRGNPPPAPGGRIYVGQADGRIDAINVDEFAAALAEQNALRAASALPPLPPPATITHEAPAGP